VLDAFGDRAFGALMLLFAAPNVLPLPPGMSAVLGAVLSILGRTGDANQIERTGPDEVKNLDLMCPNREPGVHVLYLALADREQGLGMGQRQVRLLLRCPASRTRRLRASSICTKVLRCGWSGK
jgi:hypothetical protein